MKTMIFRENSFFIFNHIVLYPSHMVRCTEKSKMQPLPDTPTKTGKGYKQQPDLNIEIPTANMVL